MTSSRWRPAARTGGQNRVDLLHYINIVEALETGLGPADVFQILQRALLAVHIVRTVTGVGQQEMAKSLSLLAELPLPDATKVLPGHESFSTLGQERSTNPYMNGAWY